MADFTFAEKLRKMKAADVLSDGQVRDQFITVYNRQWREGGEAAYDRESVYFNKQMHDKEDLRLCSAQSVYFALIDLAVRGLSLQPGAQAQCYLQSRNVAAGIDQNRNKIWEKQCSLTISGYGEIAIRKRVGQILYAENPVIVYEGDVFQSGEKDGKRFINYVATIPRTSNNIIACYVKIVKPDGTADYSVMTQPDWMRLADYSAANNAKWEKDPKTGRNYRVDGKPNELYTSYYGQIDPGFLIAKCVKHAFKTYPRIPIGRGTVYAADLGDEKEGEDGFDPYGVEEERKPEQKVPDFAPEPDMSSGVVVDPEEEDDGTF